MLTANLLAFCSGGSRSPLRSLALFLVIGGIFTKVHNTQGVAGRSCEAETVSTQVTVTGDAYLLRELLSVETKSFNPLGPRKTTLTSSDKVPWLRLC